MQALQGKIPKLPEEYVGVDGTCSMLVHPLRRALKLVSSFDNEDEDNSKNIESWMNFCRDHLPIVKPKSREEAFANFAKLEGIPYVIGDGYGTDTFQIGIAGYNMGVWNDGAYIAGQYTGDKFQNLFFECF